MSFDDRRRFERRFTPVVMDILAPIVGGMLLEQAPHETDARGGADIVLRDDPVRIGMRVRRAGYERRYPNDFTLRAEPKPKRDTELEKVMNGETTHLFYGHGDDSTDPPTITKWMFLDMTRFRGTIEAFGYADAVACGAIKEVVNTDGTMFLACDATRLGDIVIAAGERT